MGMFPLNQIARVGVSKRIGLKLFGCEIIFKEFQPMRSQYVNVKDGQTDRHTDERTDDMQSHNRAVHDIAR